MPAAKIIQRQKPSSSVIARFMGPTSQEPDWKIYFFPTYTFLNLVRTEAQTEEPMMNLLWCDEELLQVFSAVATWGLAKN